MAREAFTTSLFILSYETSPAKAGHPPDKYKNFFVLLSQHNHKSINLLLAFHTNFVFLRLDLWAD